MFKFVLFTAILQCILAQQYQQKVAPGVPPQNYQNYQPPPPPPQQMPPQQQQHPQQYAQQQQQYQPPPPPQQQQQYQQQVPVQHQQVQQPAMGGHDPHGHHPDPQLLNPANIASEREHIKEHMDVPIDTSKMSEQELQFHYFKMHDNDNNNKLDGCELIKSLIHWHDGSGQKIEHDKVYTDNELIDIIDQGLKILDANNDGYVDYSEYRRTTSAS